MKIKVNIHEVKASFSRLLERVKHGEQIIIAKTGKPVAVLCPIDETVAQRIPGNDKGKVIIAIDFDASLPEFDNL